MISQNFLKCYYKTNSLYLKFHKVFYLKFIIKLCTKVIKNNLELKILNRWSKNLYNNYNKSNNRHLDHNNKELLKLLTKTYKCGIK